MTVPALSGCHGARARGCAHPLRRVVSEVLLKILDLLYDFELIGGPSAGVKGTIAVLVNILLIVATDSDEYDSEDQENCEENETLQDVL